MESLNKINEQAIFLFIALEEETVTKINPDYKKLNELDEFTEIWELVKK